MNKQTLAKKWDQLRQVNGTAIRVIASLPADKLNSHPIPNMRTPAELVVHMYDGVIQGLAEGVAKGEATSGDESKIAAGIMSRDELVKFARERWNTADGIVKGLTDAHLASDVKTPWGFSPKGGVMIDIIYDEFLHHRGQLYAYARALGVEPPMNWDFENNEAAFKPKAAATA